MKAAPMLCAPQPTPYDLNFRLFGFPVRVHPMFWLTTLLLGPTTLNGPDGWVPIVMWTPCVFVSILLHELGHAFAYRFYRCFGVSIWIYWFGGLAGASHRPAGHWPNIFISLAGPGIQFVFLAVIYFSNVLSPWALLSDPYTLYLYVYLFAINLYWPIFNLLPIWPLDGGQVMREVFGLLRLRRPDEKTMTVTIVVAGLVSILGLIAFMNPADVYRFLPSWFPVPSLFGVLLFASLAYGAYENRRQMQAFSRGGY